jgi:hypothetical protein
MNKIKVPMSAPQEKEIYELLDKEFTITVLKKLRRLRKCKGILFENEENK